MVDTKIMCNTHLLGEHFECHMFIGYINTGKKYKGFIDNNLLEINSIEKRHDELVKEMKRRGMNHKSPIKPIIVDIEYEKTVDKKIDIESSLRDLLNRCPKCKERSNKC